jgi:dihydrofolate synthase/folylpolyglutamate synthase
MNSTEIQRADYNDAIRYLYALQKHGIKLGLDNTNRLLSLLDNPQQSFTSIHVAGTNGKGSTSAMMASVLRTAGFRVGLFTSPHLVSFTERIRVNNAEVEESEVVELTREVRDVVEREEHSALSTHGPFSPTFFEFVTAMAFLYFRRRGVEWAVVETGMGGRLDATNVLIPRISVITNISYDHREFLGRTLKEISSEKAGIIKSGIPVISSAQEPEAMEVITAKASEKKSDLFVYGKDFTSHPGRVDMHGVTFDYRGRERLNDLYVPLPGIYQIENASLAIKAMELIMERESITYDVIREGMRHTRWQGRLELMRKEGCTYDILIDGAHNPSASRTLADSLKRYFTPSYGRTILILGIMGDKDIQGIMEPLLPVPSEIIVTAPDYERAAPPEKLAEYARGMGFASRITHSVKEAIDLAVKTAGNSPQKTLLVITGSFYTIGEAKMYLGQVCSSPSLARLRE